MKPIYKPNGAAAEYAEWAVNIYTGCPHVLIKFEPCARNTFDRLVDLSCAKRKGIRTWVSFEPVLDAETIITVIQQHFDLFDRVKIGKLNYHPSGINWAKFGRDAEAPCKRLGLDYYIKEGLRAEMEKS